MFPVRRMGVVSEHRPRPRRRQDVAAAYPPAELHWRAFALYERFRPEVPAGVKGWGVAGELDVEKIRGLTP